MIKLLIINIAILITVPSLCGFSQQVYEIKCDPPASQYANGQQYIPLQQIRGQSGNLVYYVPSTYKGLVFIGGLYSCGEAAASFYDQETSYDQNRKVYDTKLTGPVKVNWSGSGIVEQGYLQFYDQGCSAYGGGRYCLKEVPAVADVKNPTEGDDYFYPYIKVSNSSGTHSYNLFYTHCPYPVR